MALAGEVFFKPHLRFLAWQLFLGERLGGALPSV